MTTMSVAPAETADTEIDRYFSQAIERAHRLSPSFALLWERLRDASRGGKRIRPRLVALVHDALGGIRSRDVAVVGASFELLHTAFVVHDDVIDRDFTRRSMPNVSGRYREDALADGIPVSEANHKGAAMGVIAGDLALTAAHRLLDQLAEDVRPAIAAELDNAIVAGAAGEVLDIEFAYVDDAVNVEDVLQMELLKTAAYSFEAPLRAGGILADASAGLLERLSQFGRDVGLAYQISDDVLGVFGNEAATGKSVVSDLRERRKTIPIVYAMSRPEWPEIDQLIGDLRETGEGYADVRSALVNCGAEDFARSLAERTGERAKATLDSPEIPDRLRDALRSLPRQSRERNR